jgi:hypothetical protein
MKKIFRKPKNMMSVPQDKMRMIAIEILNVMGEMLLGLAAVAIVAVVFNVLKVMVSCGRITILVVDFVIAKFYIFHFDRRTWRGMLCGLD